MVGAGLLPVAMHNGRVYLLFGRENELCDTPGWSDFGGGAKHGESLLDAAAREGSEELNGMLGSQRIMKMLASTHSIATLNYDTYTTFVFKTQYDAQLENYYRNNYLFFEKYLPSVKKTSDNGMLEKSEIKWFTFSDLRKNKNRFREFYRNMVDVILDNEDAITARLERRTRRTRRTRRLRVPTRSRKRRGSG